MQVEKVGMLIHPVADLATALRFYEAGLGMRVRFRDGDRFAALEAGGIVIALAAGEERVADAPAVSYKVADVDAAQGELLAAGAKLLRPAADGPHERRAVLADPAGNAFVLYASRKP